MARIRLRSGRFAPEIVDDQLNLSHAL